MLVVFLEAPGHLLSLLLVIMLCIQVNSVINDVGIMPRYMISGI